MWNQDKDNFLKCSEPHESVEAGEKAMGDFMDELADLRRKYRMRNVWLVGTFNVESFSRELVFTGGWGEYQKSLDLLAYAYGTAMGNRIADLDDIIAAGEKAGKEDAADHVVGRSDG